MGINFKETSINKMDKKKYDENFAQIDWGDMEAVETSVEFTVDEDGNVIDSKVESKIVKEKKG